ncbi:MAG TPA: hypothetical protein VEC36_04885 [Patescibacteria group bacterium]|nr:hypothetical protein [Patescibacteria group bacterium]
MTPDAIWPDMLEACILDTPRHNVLKKNAGHFGQKAIISGEIFLRFSLFFVKFSAYCNYSCTVS